MKIKVLQVLSRSFPGHGGYILRAENILDCLDYNQLEIDVVGSVFIKDEEQMNLVSKYIHKERRYFQLVDEKLFRKIKIIKNIPFLRYIFNTFLIYLNTNLLDKTLDISSYDIIHGHSTFRNGLSALLISKKYNKPFIYDIHSLSNNFFKRGSVVSYLERKLELKIINESDYIFVIDEAVGRFLTSKFNVSHKKIIAIPNGVDTKIFKRKMCDSALLSMYNIPREKIRIGLDNSKQLEGFQFIIDNYKSIISEYQNIHFVVFGGGESKNLPSFTFLPRIPQIEMANHYCLCDFFIMPRIRSEQTNTVTPLKILEIMSCEIPLLVSNVGGLNACIKDKQTGYIFEPNNLPDFIERLGLLIELNNEEIGKNARVWVEENTSWENTGAKVNDCYSKLLNSK